MMIEYSCQMLTKHLVRIKQYFQTVDIGDHYLFSTIIGVICIFWTILVYKFLNNLTFFLG